MTEFQIAMDEIGKFQMIFNSTFIAMLWEQRILEFIRVVFYPTWVSPYYLAILIGFSEQNDLAPLAQTPLYKRQVEAVATMMTNNPVVGPPKAKVGRPKKNMLMPKVPAISWLWHSWASARSHWLLNMPLNGRNQVHICNTINNKFELIFQILVIICVQNLK